MHPVEICLDRLPRVRDVGKGIVHEAWAHPERVTDFHVLLLILSGEFHVIEDGVEHVLRKGDVFFLKAGVKHWGVDKTAKGTSWYWVHFYPPEIDDPGLPKASAIQVRSAFYAAEQYHRWVTLPKRLQLKDSTDLTSRLAHLHRLFGKTSPLHRYWVSARFYEVLLALLESAAEQREASSRKQLLAAMVQEYIDTHYQRPIDSESISRELGMNYRYLSTVFREATGLRLRGYLNLVRVRQATHLLRNTAYNISEIAHRVGFADPLYFSRIFKRETGISPTEYRQTLNPPSSVS